MSCNALCEIGSKYDTDKHDAVHFPVGGDLASYYHELFKDHRQEVRKMLEIGIGHSIPNVNGCMAIEGYKPGASLRMWEEYFPNAEIYALDVIPEILINEGRIHSFLCDQSSEESLRNAMAFLGTGFDFIEDDGSHIPAHQALTARMLVPLLGPKGIYVIEDIAGENHPWGPRSKVGDNIPYKYTWKEILGFHGEVGNTTLTIRMGDQS
jgi:hypothetical protein